MCENYFVWTLDCWRLSTQHPGTFPREKNSFFKICKVLAAHIRLVFVFDRHSHPIPNSREGAHFDLPKRRELVLKMIESFGVNTVHAPGKAVAQRSNVQKKGLVDAVWSEDIGCITFGRILRLRDDPFPVDNTDRHASTQLKSNGDMTAIKVLSCVTFAEMYQLDDKSCILFTMLRNSQA